MNKYCLNAPQNIAWKQNIKKVKKIKQCTGFLVTQVLSTMAVYCSNSQSFVHFKAYLNIWSVTCTSVLLGRQSATAHHGCGSLRPSVTPAVRDIQANTPIHSSHWFTASTLQRKSDVFSPRNETARPCSQFLHYASVSDLYIPRIDLPIWLQQYSRPSWEYKNRSQIHECGNWETEHYNSVLVRTRLQSFISANT